MLKNYTIFVAIATFFLLIAGGLVTSTGSGLAVPDWPLSYGKLMPPMVGGIFYEHGHRMVATFVGLLTVMLAMFIHRSEKRRWVRRTGYAALGAVIFQGLLGGLTVILLLPTIVSASHATLGQTFFCIVITLAFVQTVWWREMGGRSAGAISKSMIVLPVAFTFVQLILGALMRHSQAGVIVPDFPLAYGGFLPSLTDEALRSYTDTLVRMDLWLWANGQITAWQVSVHLLHRYWGILLGGHLLWHAYKVWRIDSPGAGRLRLLGGILALLVAIQVTLGALTVLLGRPVDIATAHQSVGALLLGTVFLLSLHLARLNYTSKIVEPTSVTPILKSS